METRLSDSQPRMPSISIAESLKTSCLASPERVAWLDHLPEMVTEVVSAWDLTPGSAIDGEEGTCSWLTRVTRADGTPAVLKLGMPHMEGEHEIAGLRFWNGDGTVRLLEADERRGAMLLELCQPGSPLRERPPEEQDEVIAGLLHRLWRMPAAPHPFRPLATMTAFWIQETLNSADRWTDAGLVRQGLDLLEELPGTAPSQTLLVTDLHAGNVLRAEREPWLVIDPKPFIGDPAYDATQHLLNHRERLRKDWKGTVRRFAGLLGVDEERVRLWLLARVAAEPRQDWNDAELTDLATRLAG